MQHQANTTADPDKDRGALLLAVRQDETADISLLDPLADDGKFSPLTTDKYGRLKASLPDGAEVEELTVRELLTTQNVLLAKIMLLLARGFEIDLDELPDHHELLEDF